MIRPVPETRGRGTRRHGRQGATRPHLLHRPWRSLHRWPSDLARRFVGGMRRRRRTTATTRCCCRLIDEFARRRPAIRSRPSNPLSGVARATRRPVLRVAADPFSRKDRHRLRLGPGPRRWAASTSARAAGYVKERGPCWPSRPSKAPTGPSSPRPGELCRARRLHRGQGRQAAQDMRLRRAHRRLLHHRAPFAAPAARYLPTEAGNDRSRWARHEKPWRCADRPRPDCIVALAGARTGARGLTRPIPPPMRFRRMFQSLLTPTPDSWPLTVLDRRSNPSAQSYNSRSEVAFAARRRRSQTP